MQSDDVDLSAIGGRDTSELPAHYFRSFKFIGTVLVSSGLPSYLSNVPVTRVLGNGYWRVYFYGLLPNDSRWL